MRASDHDRDRAVNMLRDAYADGQLGREEFDIRSTAALTATTGGELHDLTVDLQAVLPGSPPSTAAARPWAQAMAHRRHIRLAVACLLEIVAALAARLFPPVVGLAAIAVLLILAMPLCRPRRGGRPPR
jgi:DUF1707 SHOCT-like domain